MSLVNRSIDPLVYLVVGVTAFVLLLFLVLIPAMEYKNNVFKEQKEIILNSNCDELKHMIIADIEGAFNFIGSNTDRARDLYEWKCEK